jgi:cAMP-dependent protein kinase regulator
LTTPRGVKHDEGAFLKQLNPADFSQISLPSGKPAGFSCTLPERRNPLSSTRSPAKHPVAPNQKTFPPGTLLLREGEAGDEAYFLLSGKVEIFKNVDGKKFVINRVGAGAVVGEMAIIDNQPRMACAATMEPTDALVISREAFAEAFNKAPKLVQYMLQTQVNTLRSLAGGPKQSAPIVDGMQVVISHHPSSEPLDRRIYQAGQRIITQGQPGTSAFLIQSGEVEIWRESASGEKEPLRRIGAGSVFGEMALLEDKPRAASATALEATTVEIVKTMTFEKLVAQSPPIIRAILKSYIGYVHQMRGRAGK